MRTLQEELDTLPGLSEAIEETKVVEEERKADAVKRAKAREEKKKIPHEESREEWRIREFRT
jgi:hypothetical protein